MNIYAGSLSYDVTDEDLKSAFETYGKVNSASVIKDRFSGESRGFGFVEMESNEEGKAAIEALNGTQLKGKNITVNEARPKNNDRSNNRGGGRGGSRRGGGGYGDRGGYGGGGKRRF